MNGKSIPSFLRIRGFSIPKSGKMPGKQAKFHENSAYNSK